jgi:hypothetical protein
MAIEIVDLPRLKKHVIFHSYVSLPEGIPWYTHATLNVGSVLSAHVRWVKHQKCWWLTKLDSPPETAWVTCVSTSTDLRWTKNTWVLHVDSMLSIPRIYFGNSQETNIFQYCQVKKQAAYRHSLKNHPTIVSIVFNSHIEGTSSGFPRGFVKLHLHNKKWVSQHNMVWYDLMNMNLIYPLVN